MALESWALISLEEAREMVDAELTKDDGFLEVLVNAASLSCERETSRKLKSRTYTDELYDGTGTTALKIREYPVTAWTAYSFLQSVAPDTWTSQDTSTYPAVIWQPTKDVVILRNNVFPYGLQNVKATYTAGLTSIPADLKQACAIIVLDLFKQKDKQKAGVASVSAMGQTVQYLNEPIPTLAARLLGPYCRMVC